jgi:Domain of unknown function (DUF4335)
MNPSSFNQNFRSYSQDTCDLMIEDKKSPFPTWMNFNKPNPLKFSLGLTDPDNPEQAPVRITGDRGKLESLHQAVESYVSKLLSKPPLPQINVDQPKSPGISQPKPPAPSNFNLKVGDGSIKIKMGDAPINNTDRPIDALNLTGDQPHLEPDGLSRHLLYLGNIATDNQVMVSLNTLQLFDLASTLAEGISPISSAVTGEMTDFGAAVVPPMIGEETTVEVVKPDITPSVTNRFANSVTEPRVVKSVEQNNSNNDSEEFSSTGAASSLLRVKKSSERFKVPNITFNKSRFTGSPDSSLSPLSTYWPWLGVGTLAAGIIAATLLGGNGGKESSSSTKPTVNPTAVAKASTSVTEFQPSPIPTPSALEGSTSPTPNPALSSSQPAGASGTGAVLVTPSLPNPAMPGTVQVPGRSAAGLSNATPNGLNMGIGGSPFGSPSLSPSGKGNASKSSSGKTPVMSSKSQPPAVMGRPITPDRGPIVQGVPVGSEVGGNGFSVDQMAGSSDAPFSSSLDKPKLSRQSGKAVKPAKAVKRPAAPTNISDSLPGSVAAGDDLFAPADSKNSDSPVKQLPVDNNPNPLDAPVANSSGTTQATETQSYFQKRWKADPNFSETLQYVIRLDKSGKVVQVNPQGDVSKNYLDKTNFLRSGEKVVSPSRNGKDQDVRVLLKPNGEVETIVEP